jgi:hypothetical protein
MLASTVLVKLIDGRIGSGAGAGMYAPWAALPQSPQPIPRELTADHTAFGCLTQLFRETRSVM